MSNALTFRMGSGDTQTDSAGFHYCLLHIFIMTEGNDLYFNYLSSENLVSTLHGVSLANVKRCHFPKERSIRDVMNGDEKDDDEEEVKDEDNHIMLHTLGEQRGQVESIHLPFFFPSHSSIPFEDLYASIIDSLSFPSSSLVSPTYS